MIVSTSQSSESPTAADIGTVPHITVGSGEIPVVPLHGLFGSPANWQAVMVELANHYQFHALQLPIDPHEDRCHKSFHSIGQLTDYVERFFDEKALERAVLCGNSLGGQVAIDFHPRHPDRVDRLVLAGSAGLFENNLANSRRIRLTRSMVREQACGIFYDPQHVDDELVDDVYSMLEDRQYRRFLLKVSKATRDRYMLDELPDVDVPTMIIWEASDTITPPFVAEQFCERISNARLAFIDRCGHAPPIERPKEFACLLHGFLSEIPSSGTEYGERKLV